MCGTDGESGDGLSTTTHKDVHSDVSSADDADEEIDTTLIEEEDCIEYIQREAPKKRWKAQRFDAGPRLTKNEMETGTEYRHVTQPQMAKKERLLTGTLN